MLAAAASALLLATMAEPPPAPIVDIAVRFEVEGLPLPEGTTCPRLPAGLHVDLIPSIAVDGRPISEAVRESNGIAIRWLKIVPASDVTSNLQVERKTGAQRIAATPLRNKLVPLSVTNPWRVDADALAPYGTVRFMVVVDLPGHPNVASTPGPESQYELKLGTPGGLSPDVYGLTRRRGEDLAGVAAELYGLPFLLNPLGDPASLHQTEQRQGMDCTSTFIYAQRRLGADLVYYGPKQVWPYLDVLTRDLHLDKDGVVRIDKGSSVPSHVGDLLHFGTQLSLIAQDRWPFGILDAHDLLLQSWKSPPHLVTLRDSGYATYAAAVARFRDDLPRFPSAGVTVQIEDSHAGSFFHLLPRVREEPATLILIDAHSDASPHPLSAEMPQHEFTADWLRRLRDKGVIQPFNWVDALIPWGVKHVLWLGPWDEADPKAEQEAARKMLCSLAREYPSHGFECRAERFSAAALEEILALPPDLPVVISVDLDFLLRRDGRVDFSRARRLQQVLGHFARPRAISAALSRPYFSDDASFEAALRLFSAALWTTPTVGATGLDLTEVQHDDRSLKAKELHDAGKPLPKPRWEQAASTPGLRIVNAPPHAAFGLLGDVYRSDANAPIPTEPPLAARRASWQPTESLPLIANLETPVADQLPLQGYPRFNAHASLLDRLAAEGVLIVNLANNHALDQGVEGLQTTIRAAHDRGIGVVGAWLPGDSGSGIERLQIGDLKCAFLGVTSRLNEHAREASAIDYVPFEEYPQSRSSREAESRFLQKVRDATNGADLVVVLVHGGNEYSSAPSMGQKRFFHALAEAGARVIAGTHSHRAGPVELTNGTLMAWGLGDYFLDQRGSGMGLRVYAERDGESVQVRFEEMKARGRSPRAEDRMPGVEGSTDAAAP